MARPKKPKQAQNRPQAQVMRRTTAMSNAMFEAFENAGFDLSNAVLPTKRELAWRVSRKS